MILTGSKIEQEVKKANITIIPFKKDQLNPNSYNYRIGDEIIVFLNRKTIKKKISSKGFILKPHRIYLANTYEILGSNKYAMSLIGRSSLGRLGLFLQISANLGHTGSNHSWTLELVSTKPIKIYPHMIIGQISFWDNFGKFIPNTQGYTLYNCPTLSKIKGLR
jgi:dCTP deaminase